MAQPKSVSANTLYLSKVLPIFEEAETRIKTLILTAFLTMQPKYLLMYSIIAIIKGVANKIPPEIENKEAYINGLYKSSLKWVKMSYDKPRIKYLEVKQNVEELIPGGTRLPNLARLLNLMNISTRIEQNSIYGQKQKARHLSLTTIKRFKSVSKN